jgi:nicotinamidase-related amidase
VLKMKGSFENWFQKDKVGQVTPLAIENIGGKRDSGNQKDVLLLGIDYQNDFLENGNLAVPNSYSDVTNFARFIYENVDAIDDIYMSLDTHTTNQIFHPTWWVNSEGEHPKPYTIITSNDVQDGKWKPVFYVKESIQYLKDLESSGKKQLMIWPFHCLQGTFGASIEPQLSNVLFAYSLYKGRDVRYVTKGLNPISEMYGIIKPECSTEKSTNDKFIQELSEYKKIVIGGEAKSHCVLESVKQIVESFESIHHKDYTLYILEDCTTSIPGFEEETDKEFRQLAEKYPIILTDSSLQL